MLNLLQVMSRLLFSGWKTTESVEVRMNHSFHMCNSWILGNPLTLFTRSSCRTIVPCSPPVVPGTGKRRRRHSMLMIALTRWVRYCILIRMRGQRWLLETNDVGDPTKILRLSLNSTVSLRGPCPSAITRWCSMTNVEASKSSLYAGIIHIQIPAFIFTRCPM